MTAFIQHIEQCTLGVQKHTKYDSQRPTKKSRDNTDKELKMQKFTTGLKCITMDIGTDDSMLAWAEIETLILNTPT